MKPRNRKTLQQPINVIIRDDRTGYTATINNVSRDGLSVTTDHVFPTYKVVEVLVKLNDRPFQLRGSVRWVREPIPARAGDREVEMGIALIKPPREFLAFFDLNDQSS